MKSLVAFVALAAFASASPVDLAMPEGNSAYGYHKNIGIELAEKIRQSEESLKSDASRIIGGNAAVPGQFPFQAGLLIDLIGFDGLSVCGASLISTSRVLTAAHCWFDGTNQAWRFTVSLGSTLLFTAPTQLQTSVIVSHPNWLPTLARNDVAVAYLPTNVQISNLISPIALPSGSEVFETFAGEVATASGFGRTGNDSPITTAQSLNYVRLNVLPNNSCLLFFPLFLQSTNICTSGVGTVGTCRGDSGGPLTVVRNGRPIVIGITSFGSGLGCEANFPSVYARTTSYIDFINQNL